MHTGSTWPSHAPWRGGAQDEPFSPSPASCRRAIGIAAVALCLRDRTLAPAQAVAQLLERTADPREGDRRSAWWAEWFRRIPPGARAVVQSEAVAWATQLYGALEWGRIERQVTGRLRLPVGVSRPPASDVARQGGRTGLGGGPPCPTRHAHRGRGHPLDVDAGTHRACRRSGRWSGLGAGEGRRHVARLGTGPDSPRSSTEPWRMPRRT